MVTSNPTQPKEQISISTREGYDQAEEDHLLASISWWHDGYRLFEVACLAPSSKGGWFGALAESNCRFLHRHMFDELGGFDPAFQFPGGGLVNLGFFKRAVEAPGTEYFLLLSEASFHQVHRGITTNPGLYAEQKSPFTHQDYATEYQRIRGQPYYPSNRQPILHGRVKPCLLALIAQTALTAVQS